MSTDPNDYRTNIDLSPGQSALSVVLYSPFGCTMATCDLLSCALKALLKRDGVTWLECLIAWRPSYVVNSIVVWDAELEEVKDAVISVLKELDIHGCDVAFTCHAELIWRTLRSDSGKTFSEWLKPEELKKCNLEFKALRRAQKMFAAVKTQQLKRLSPEQLPGVLSDIAQIESKMATLLGRPGKELPDAKSPEMIQVLQAVQFKDWSVSDMLELVALMDKVLGFFED